MGKKTFRSPAKRPDASSPSYPTLDSFESGRRQFLLRLGGALLGAGAMATLSACGDGRPVGGDPDASVNPPPGAAPMPDARLDGVSSDHSGAAPMPDARADHMRYPPMGEAPQPDARIDGQPPVPPDGAAPMPDARADQPDATPHLGFAPLPDAASDCDGGSCPNP